jgi:RNA polymerase sigma factor (sigma-70 family)
MPPPPTVDLVPRIRRGEAAAFTAFYEAWFDGAFALARTVSRRGEDFCLDVVQDVMLKVVNKLPALATEAAVASWMSKAVVSAALDRLRSDQRRQRRETAVAAVQPVAHDPEPLHELAIAERRDWLAAQLAGLPTADRALLCERFYGEQTLAAVGAQFGMNADVAHGRLRRLVLRLQQAAKEWFGDNPR